MNIRHGNRVTSRPQRSTRPDRPAYSSKARARAAAEARRYGRSDRADLTAAAKREG